MGRLVIVGNRGGTNVGQSLERAAMRLGHSVELVEARLAMEGPRWRRIVSWHVQGRKPPRLNSFSEAVEDACRRSRASLLLTTGMAPITGPVLARIRSNGTVCANFSTDDPWNPEQRAEWFLDALGQYDAVFTPRSANIPQFRSASKASLSLLPFGYDPDLFFPVDLVDGEKEKYAADVVFVGGADRERAAYLGALRQAGIDIALYGDGWDSYGETQQLTRGHAPPLILRNATCGAKVALCMVRHRNRDGHVMRTYEAAAMRACMVVERTPDHEELFGQDGAAVLYFNSGTELVEKVRWLVARPDERSRLAAAAHHLIVNGRHTYADRLEAMLQHTLQGACA